MKVRPLNDRVLVKRVEEEKKSKGGIIIPDTAKEKPQEGRVVAVGTGKVLENGSTRALEVSKGDRVLFSRSSRIRRTPTWCGCSTPTSAGPSMAGRASPASGRHTATTTACRSTRATPRR